jgi:ABC-type glutathione transport system ATPase component
MPVLSFYTTEQWTIGAHLILACDRYLPISLLSDRTSFLPFRPRISNSLIRGAQIYTALALALHIVPLLDMMAKVGLADRFDYYPDQLSGGQQQRVAIARSLAMFPKVLPCEEITSALDPELVNEVLAVVRKLAEDRMP